MLDSRPKGPGSEPHWGHCIVSLSKTHWSFLSTGSTQEDLSRFNWKIVDWDVKNQINKKTTTHFCQKPRKVSQNLLSPAVKIGAQRVEYFSAFQTLCMLGNISCFYCSLLTFQNKLFSKNYFSSTIRVSNGLDPDKDRHFVGPYLGPTCLQRLSADNKSGRRQGKSKMQWLMNVLYIPDEFHHRDEWFPVYPPFPPPPPPPPPPPAVEDFADDSFAIFGKLPVYA